MVKVIVYIVKATITVVLSLFCISCGFQSVNGEGNVTTQNRNITENFKSVSADKGLQVIVEQSAQQSVSVEADQNLLGHITTKVKNGELRISSDVNIGNGTKTITVKMPELKSLTSESSADIKCTSPFKGDSMKFSSSSGSSILARLEGRNIQCEADSGAHIEITGQTENLETNTSSGGNINAKTLKAVNVRSNASSGGEITVNPTKNLSADASSGGKIYYVATPGQLKKNASSGGVVSQL